MKKIYMTSQVHPKRTQASNPSQKKKLAVLLVALCLAQGAVEATALAGYDMSRLTVRQGTEVTGKVIGDDGVGVPGATVVVKGTTVGTATDAEGSFVLNVPNGSGTLVVSFIGFKYRFQDRGSSY